jgi:CDP-diacylglycerol--serine O-phosphatidyltransferase
MTAGNLFCGFCAIMNILTYWMEEPKPPTFAHYYWAIGLILGACLFDALDGRIARMVGEESPFGREFDSLADTVSFGVAPALLVHDVVLKEMSGDRIGWFISFFYLLCGTMRLARFNCTAATGPSASASKDFQGCPIPAAAGVISSLTLLLLDIYEKERMIGAWKYALVVVMVILSLLMFSSVPYPSFKGLGWKTKRSFPWVLGAMFLLMLVVWKPKIMFPTLFLSYLFYGLIRPWVSKRWIKEIEEDEDEDEEVAAGGSAAASKSAEVKPSPADSASK